MRLEEKEEEQKDVEEVKALYTLEKEEKAQTQEYGMKEGRKMDLEGKAGCLAMGRDEDYAQRPLVMGGLLQVPPWLGPTWN